MSVCELKKAPATNGGAFNLLLIRDIAG